MAIAVGTEKEGLTDLALGAADERVRIPMVGRVNSLNAATAAAVVVYEAVRQRSDEAGVTPVTVCWSRARHGHQVDRAVSGAPLDVCDDDGHAS